MPDPVSFMVAEWTLSGVLGGLYRVLSRIHHLVMVAPGEQKINAALAAELDKLMMLCGSKVGEFRGRAVYRAPGAVAALSYVEGQVKVQQTMLEESMDDPKIWRRTNTRDALQMLKNVHDDLCKAFAVGLITATTEMQMVMLDNQAGHGAILRQTNDKVDSVLDNQLVHGEKIDKTHVVVCDTRNTVVSIHTLMETIKSNLEAIRQTTDGSTQQLHEAAVKQPLQKEEGPREEETKIIWQVMEKMLMVQSTTLLDPTSMDLMIDPVTCSDGRTHCRWEAFKVMDSCNNMPGCSKGGFKVVFDNVDIRGTLFEEHPAQERRCAEKRADHLEQIDKLLAEDDMVTAITYIQRALQWLFEGSPEHQALQRKLNAVRKAMLTGTKLDLPLEDNSPPPSPVFDFAQDLGRAGSGTQTPLQSGAALQASSPIQASAFSADTAAVPQWIPGNSPQTSSLAQRAGSCASTRPGSDGFVTPPQQRSSVAEAAAAQLPVETGSGSITLPDSDSFSTPRRPDSADSAAAGGDKSQGSAGASCHSRPQVPLEEAVATCLAALKSDDALAARDAPAAIADLRPGQMRLRVLLVEAGAVPLLSALAAAAASDVERSILAARALVTLAAGGPRCRAAVATAGVATSLVHLLQVDVADEGLRRQARAAAASALTAAVQGKPAAAAAAATQGATEQLAALIASGMFSGLYAPALTALAALAAAGQADGVAAEVLLGPNFIGQEQMVAVLRCGPTACSATALLVRVLAADRSANYAGALLQRGAAALLTQLLQHPLEVAGASEGDVATLQRDGLVALEALVAAGGDARELLPAALGALAAGEPAIAATAAEVVAQLALAPRFPEALRQADGARRLVEALRCADPATAIAIAEALAAAAHAHTAAHEALLAAGAPAALALLQQRGSGTGYNDVMLPMTAKAALAALAAPSQHGLGRMLPAAGPVSHWPEQRC